MDLWPIQYNPYIQPSINLGAWEENIFDPEVFESLVMTCLLNSVFYNCLLSVVSAGKTVQWNLNILRHCAHHMAAPTSQVYHLVLIKWHHNFWFGLWNSGRRNFRVVLWQNIGLRGCWRKLSDKVLTMQSLGPDTESQAPYTKSQAQCYTSINPVEVRGWKMEISGS